MTRMQSKTIPQAFAVIATISLLLTSMSVAAQVVAPIPPLAAQKIPLEQVVAIPRDVIAGMSVPNLSRVDWNQPVLVGGKQMALSSKEGLATVDVPPAIRKLVEGYRGDLDAAKNAEVKKHITQALEYDIAEYLIDKGELPKEYHTLKTHGAVESIDRTFNIREKAVATLNSSKKIEVGTSDAKIIRIGTRADKSSSLIGRAKKKISDVVSMVTDLIAGVPAKATVNASIDTEEEWVTAAEVTAQAALSTSAKKALQYILDYQNADGSWGNATTSFMTTVAVLDALFAVDEKGTAYQGGVSWIESYLADNSDYLAEQTRITWQSGATTTPADMAQTLAYNLDEFTGGFPVARGYQSDTLTTAKVLRALHETHYQDFGSNPDLTKSLALYYLVQIKRFDNRWSAFDSGVSSIPVTIEAIQALLPYKGGQLVGFGATQIAINDTLLPALNALKTTQSANGSWNGDVLDTALALYTLKKANMTPVYVAEGAAFLENAQVPVGNIGNLYTTAQALRALAHPGAASGNLAILDIIPKTTLQTGLSATIEVRIKNNGNSTVDNAVLHMVADSFVAQSFDFAASDISIEPGQTLHLNIQITSTSGYVGDVVFDFFVEGKDGIIHQGARLKKTLTFAPTAENMPGLPIYFIAHKYVFSGQPAINVRWGLKSDPNRDSYLVLWRLSGTTTWSTLPISNTSNGGYLYPFAENGQYEVTVGAAASDGRIIYYNTPVLIKTSASSTKYAAGSVSGTLKDLSGPVPTVLFSTGNNLSTTNSNGAIALTGFPYGRGWILPRHFLYEPYVTTFELADTALADFSAYTNKLPDTANPTITYLAIAGEFDYSIPNAEPEIIHLGVSDDVGDTVESATFSFFDPHDNLWHLLGTMQGPLSGTVGYTWDIPSTMLGTEYKIKAIVRDYSGKESAPVEWGPFQLTLGNMTPEFAFDTPLGATSTVADLSYTILWSDRDDDDNAVISIFYDLDRNPNNGNSTSIATLFEDDSLNGYILNTSALPAGTYYLLAIVSDNINPNQIIYANPAIIIRHSAPTAPSKMLTEAKTNPINISDPTPEFSAVFNSPISTDKTASYRLQVSATSTFIGDPQWDSGKMQLASTTRRGARIPDISYAGLQLASTTPYYWRIKLWNTAGLEGAWSTTTASFTLARSTDKAPTAPTSLLTEGKANPIAIKDSTPEFSAIFNDATTTDIAIKYRLQIATSTTFASPLWDSGTTLLSPMTSRGARIPDISYSGPKLASSTVHYWRIKFWDKANNEGAWSTVVASFSLQRSNLAPTAPTALLIEGLTNPTAVMDKTPEFSAIFNDPDSVDRATKYYIQVSTSTSFTPLIWNPSVTTLASTTPVGLRVPDISYAGHALVPNTTYYWRIRLVDSIGAAGAWSARGQFKLAPGAI